jgi:probable HAF family extracellular repeat protein
MMVVLPTGALPLGVSSSGTVVGYLRSGGAFYWMPTSGVVYLGGYQALTVSRDGRSIAGDALDANRVHQAGIWQRAAEWRLLGSITPTAKPCDDLLSKANKSSADGRVLVGLAWDTCSIARAFRWEEGTGMVNLGTTVPNRSTRANGVSGDGKVVVGWQQLTNGTFQAAKWVDGVQTLYTGTFGPLGDAWAANIDGSIIVGQECQPPNPLDQSAWIWTTTNGVECLPVPRFRSALDGRFLGRAEATSDDGRVIGGGHAVGLESEAVIWLDRQPHYLKDYLHQNGVPDAFDGWVNTGSITGISRDGRVVVGFGAGPKDFTGYLVVLPAPGNEK